MKKRRRLQVDAPGDAASILDRCTPADFDGHTAFLSFGRSQRCGRRGRDPDPEQAGWYYMEQGPGIFWMNAGKSALHSVKVGELSMYRVVSRDVAWNRTEGNILRRARIRTFSGVEFLWRTMRRANWARLRVVGPPRMSVQVCGASKSEANRMPSSALNRMVGNGNC